MSSLVKLYTQMKSEFTQAAQFFGENPSQVQLDDFFCNFATFIIDFEVSERKMYMYHTACTTLTLSLSLSQRTLSSILRAQHEESEKMRRRQLKQVLNKCINPSSCLAVKRSKTLAGRLQRGRPL